MPKEQKTIMASQAPAQSPAEEIKQLMAVLAGNPAFAECRGNLDIPIDEILENSNNPTQALAKFDRAVAARRSVVHRLAKFKRDGLKYAYDEYWSALTNRDFLFTGETVLIQETMDGYLLIVDLDLTLMFLRWLYSTHYEKDIVPYLKVESPDPSRAMYGRLTKDVFRRFPKIEEELRVRMGQPLHLHSYFHTPIKFFFDEVVKPFWDKVDRKYIPECPSCSWKWIDVNDRSQGEQWQRGGAVAIFVTEIGIKELLSCFLREEQKRLTIWRFKVPKVERCNLAFNEWSRRSPQMRIGLHPAPQHPMWAGYHPSYVSKNVTRGLGAVLLTNDMVNDEYQDDSPMKGVVPMYTALGFGDRRCCEAPQEHMDRQRLLLCFPYCR